MNYPGRPEWVAWLTVNVNDVIVRNTVHTVIAEAGIYGGPGYLSVTVRMGYSHYYKRV